MPIEEKLKEMRSDKAVEDCNGQYAMELQGKMYCMANYAFPCRYRQESRRSMIECGFKAKEDKGQ
jgi:hypothetical protein